MKGLENLSTTSGKHQNYPEWIKIQVKTKILYDFENKNKKKYIKKSITFLWEKMDEQKVNKIFEQKKSKNIKAICISSAS